MWTIHIISLSVVCALCRHLPSADNRWYAKLADGRVTMIDLADKEEKDQLRREREWLRATAKVPEGFHKYDSPTWKDHTLYRGKEKKTEEEAE